MNAGDVTAKVWMDNTVQSSQNAVSCGITTRSVNPSGKRKRLIVVHTGSKDGFVSRGLLSFESKKNTRDYLDEMNG